MVLNGAFTALFLLISGASAVTVPPPINVSVSCENFVVTVSWEYPEQQPQTTFRVNIRSSAGHFEEETTDHQFDLSDIIWESQDRYMGFYHVSVTAIQGGNQSEAGATDSFSFNHLKTSNMKCKLVFPPVNLIETDFGAILKFENPLLAYEKLKRTLESDDASFAFSVISNDGEFLKACDKQNIDRDDCDSCALREEICEHDILFAKGTKKCVRLKGRLFDKGHVGQVLFEETESICATKPYEAPVVLLVTLLSITALVISLLTVFICKAKAWTMETPKSLPKPLVGGPHPWRRGFEVIDVCDTDISPVSAPVSKPCKTPSVNSEEEEHDPTDHCDGGSGSGFGSGFGSGLGSVSQPSACGYTDGKELEGSSLLESDDESADSSLKTVSISLEEEEEEEEKPQSPYDSPHVLQVDMPDKDMVTAHREK